MPPSLEARVAYLEGKLEEHSRGFGEIRELLVHLNGRVDALDQKMDSRFEALERNFDSRTNGIDTRINVLDQKVDRFRSELAGQIGSLDHKVSRQFIWSVGIQVAILLSIIGALLGQ